MHRMGIVGCGITGSITAMLLKQKMPYLNIVILEKSRGTGKLLEARLLQPLQAKIEGLKATSPTATHFICPLGSGSLVKHFLQIAGCEVLFGKKVTEIHTVNKKWVIFCDDGSNHEFDALVLTMPAPQVLQLNGIMSHLESNHLDQLKSVKYCSRFALGYFYHNDLDFFKKNTWIAKFVSDDIVRFCSLDLRKRDASRLPSVAIHTTKEFGEAHIDENHTAVIQDQIVQRVQQLFPEMPFPTDIKFHKWRYSQVEKSCSMRDAQRCLVLSEKPILICGGDSFSYSTFEGCVSSAESIVQIIDLEQNI